MNLNSETEDLKNDLKALEFSLGLVRKEWRETLKFYGRDDYVPANLKEQAANRERRLNKQIARMSNQIKRLEATR
jgi:hypothetical protein